MLHAVGSLGAYHTTWGVGPHVKLPIIDRVAKRVSLKEQVVDFAPQPVITKDNVTMQIDTVILISSGLECLIRYPAGLRGMTPIMLWVSRRPGDGGL